jgi:circadian clock protein KaiC
MVDGLLDLASRHHGRRSERDLEVRKFRGSGFLRGRHTFRITDDGLVVFPRTEALYRTPSRADRADGPPVSLGSDKLDALLNGGLPCHSVTMLAGPAGIGKTTLGLQFLGAGGADEAGVLLGFHESREGLRVKARALNLPVAEMIEAGQVEVLWEPATEGLIDEACLRLMEAVRRRGARRVFIDGLDALRKLAEDEDRTTRIFAALTAEFRALSVTGMYTSEIDLFGPAPGHPMSSVSLRGVSSTAENIVLMRYVELRSELHRMISLLKARDTRIDQRLRCFDIRSGGVAVDADPERADAILLDLQYGQFGLPRASSRRRGE